MEIAIKIADIALKIKALVENVRANKKRCQRLADRVSVLVSLIQELPFNESTSKKYTLALESLYICVERCLTFIQTFTDSNWFIRIYDQACHRDTFDELTRTLTICAENLNLSFVIHQFFKSEQDDEDRREDRTFLKDNFDVILRLQSEHAQQQKVQLGNIERMMQSLIDNNKQNLDAMIDDSKRQSMREEELMFVHVKYSQVNLQQMIASGSSGNVFIGRCNHSKVVVKELRMAAMRGHERKEFVAAVALLSRIRHENIVQFLGACIEKPDRYLVLSEFMPLGSLAAVLQSKTPTLTWDDRWSIAKQMANGILYLHSFPVAPMVHKDIKSSNILLDHCGGQKKYRTKVNDFGLDQIHTTIGTLPWSAPETLNSNGRRIYTVKSDVYSLGVVMWELATGQVPYGNSSPERIIQDISSGQQLPILYERMPRIYGDLLYQTWNDDPKERLSCEQVYIRLVIGSKRRDGLENLWPDLEEKSVIHLDPPNLLDYMLVLKHQFDLVPRDRDLQELLIAADQILRLFEGDKMKKMLIQLNTIQHLIGIAESLLETKNNNDDNHINLFINVTCELHGKFALISEVNNLILEQGGVVFLLHVIRMYAAKDNIIVTKASEALGRLNCDNSTENEELSSEVRVKNDRSSVPSESDTALVIHRVVERIQRNGGADERVVTMIEELLDEDNNQDKAKTKRNLFSRFFRVKRKKQKKVLSPKSSEDK
jgi:serine/threonine protein kinase